MNELDIPQFTIEAARIASDDKCENVVILDLRNRCTVADYFLVATGTSDRQMSAVCDHIAEYAHRIGLRPFKIARLESPVWVLLDFVTVVVHVFDRAHRDYYDLELLWGDAPRLEWTRSATA